MKHRFSLFALLLGLTVGISAEEQFPHTFTVSPGNNGTHILASAAYALDRITVNFVPASGYELVSAEVDDEAGLGWTRTGKFSFSLLIATRTQKRIWHTTPFNGTLRRITDGAGPGSGGKEDLIPWNLDGRFRVFDAIEGVGDDLGRDPPAGLVSSKPGGGPQPRGVATFNTTTGQFDGTVAAVVDGVRRTFLGDYFPGTAHVDEATKAPEQIGTERKAAPDITNPTVEVIYVYFGASTGGGIGGKANPDRIRIDTYPPATNLMELMQARDAVLAARYHALGALLNARIAEWTAAATAGAARLWAIVQEAAYQAALDGSPRVVTAKDRLETEQARLAELQAALVAAEATLNAAKQRQQDYTGNDPKILASLQHAVTQAEARVTQAQNRIPAAAAAVARAQASLERAINQALRDPAVVAARDAAQAAGSAADAAEAAYLAAQEETLAKQTALDEAEQALVVAQEALDEAMAQADAVAASWLGVYADTFVHEEGHRRITYFFVDQLTDMLNKLRAWGYAKQEARAAELGKAHYIRQWGKLVPPIQEAASAMHTLYDSREGTDHGYNQGNWDWEDRLR